MAILGDDRAADLRRHMLSVSRFAAIEAFPQKDRPKDRIFPEANQKPFRSRVHPARFIEGNSPGLTLCTASIPLYDPSNLTVVSCDQTDWDLATRIMASGRMGRLQQYAEFFQGEVNEALPG